MKNLDAFRASSLEFLLAITYETIQTLSTAFDDEQRSYFSEWCALIHMDTRQSALHLRRLVEAIAQTELRLDTLLTPMQYACFEKARIATMAEMAQA